MYKTIVIVLAVIFGIGLLVGLAILVGWLTLQEELDDVHPWIMNADDPHIKRSSWLWVIPLYMDEPISNHPEWVESLKKSGKKIGLHGVRHTKLEFSIDRSDEYIDKGVNEFFKAFGYPPTHFKAPGLAMTKANAQKIRDRGMKIRNRFHQITRRVHHSPKGRLPNGWLVGEASEGLSKEERRKLQRHFYSKEHSS